MSSATAEAKTGVAWFQKAMALYEARKYKEAIDAFKQAIRLGPEDKKMHFHLGMTYYSLNRFREAGEEFKRAVELDPKYAEAHFRLGWVGYVLGRKKEAQEQYEILRTLKSDYSEKLYKIIREDAGAGSSGNASSLTKRTSKSQSNQTPATGTSDDASPEEPLVTSRLVSTNNRPVETPLAASTSSAIDPAAPKEKPTATPNAPVRHAETTATSTSAVANASAPDDSTVSPTSIYRLGVGDVLDIRLLNSASNRSTLYSVMEGGLIDFPLAGGPIPVAGLTTDQISAQLSAELKRRKIEEGSQPVVSVRQYNSHSVIITGLVNNQGARIIRREAVPLYVILAEAQLHPNAGRATITRPDGSNSIVDLGEPTAVNALVFAGDVINVTTRPTQYYYIAGQVITPGQKIYQSGISLLQAILAAGGLIRPTNARIEIYREDTTGHLFTFEYSLKDIKSGKIADPRLLPGDRIEVGN
ncbi:MAG TPA: tetratricopeptide repeat protein [Pyrinomonadaceae bacterium]|nr:tetratricopeptide repeat protein [Pyrinomonadaceae bacterium]